MILSPRSGAMLIDSSDPSPPLPSRQAAAIASSLPSGSSSSRDGVADGVAWQSVSACDFWGDSCSHATLLEVSLHGCLVSNAAAEFLCKPCGFISMILSSRTGALLIDSSDPSSPLPSRQAAAIASSLPSGSSSSPGGVAWQSVSACELWDDGCSHAALLEVSLYGCLVSHAATEFICKPCGFISMTLSPRTGAAPLLARMLTDCPLCKRAPSLVTSAKNPSPMADNVMGVLLLLSTSASTQGRQAAPCAWPEMLASSAPLAARSTSSSPHAVAALICKPCEFISMILSPRHGAIVKEMSDPSAPLLARTLAGCSTFRMRTLSIATSARNPTPIANNVMGALFPPLASSFCAAVSSSLSAELSSATGPYSAGLLRSIKAPGPLRCFMWLSFGIMNLSY